MTTPKKRTHWIERTINAAAHTVTFDLMRQLPDEDKPTIEMTRVFDWTNVHADNVAYATGHGFAARLGDKSALPVTATMQERWDAIGAMAAHYESGVDSWNVKGTRKAADPEAMLRNWLESNPEKAAEIAAAAQARIAAKVANATG